MSASITMKTGLRSLKGGLLTLINRCAQPAKIQLLTTRQAFWWRDPHTFLLDGKSVPYFFHRYNCGWPPGRVTERSVEMALADAWLSKVDAADVWEVGAVSPYYWPGRVRQILDPGDPHVAVTCRESFLDRSLAGQTILSISTFEHIGTNDYGMTEAPELLGRAFQKLFTESPRFLVTVPLGYNANADAYLSQADQIPSDVRVRDLVRSAQGNRWTQIDSRNRSVRPYGRNTNTPAGWANHLVLLERGGLL